VYIVTPLTPCLPAGRYPSPACGPSPSAGRPPRRDGEIENDLKNNIRVDSSQGIIQHHPISPFHSLQKTNRRGFENIKKSKEKKTEDDEEDCPG